MVWIFNIGVINFKFKVDGNCLEIFIFKCILKMKCICDMLIVFVVL